METVQLPPQAGQTVARAHGIFGPRLIGASLYGSATLRGLRPDSDLDILLTLDGRVGEGERQALTRMLLTLSAPPGTPGRRPLEVTVVDRNILLEDVFPPAYEYQFGEWLRPDIERGNLPQPAADPDLALLFWQARSHSLPLFGEPAERLIPPVPFSRVRQAIYGALPSLLDNLEGDERNVLLTLARMWYTLSTGGLGSKDQAAEWAAARLPEPFSAPLLLAARAYRGEAADHWETESVRPLARALQDKIRALSAAEGG